MRKTIIILTLLSITFVIKAQPMDLKSCIDYALQHNLSLSNAQLNQAVSYEDYQQSRRSLLPTVEGSSLGTLLFGKSIDPTTNDFVNQQLFSTRFSLSTQLSLFNGFIKQNKIRFNKIQYQIKKEDVEQEKITIAFETMNFYFDVLYYKELLVIVKEQVNLTNMNLQKTKKLIENGLKAHSDFLEMEAQQASEQHNQLQVENQYDLALLNLKKVMNYPLNKGVEIENSLNLLQNSNLELSEIYEKAVTNMPLIKKSRLNIDAGKRGVKMSRGELFPSLYIGANYSTNYADSNREKVYTDDPDSKEYRLIPFNRQLNLNASQSVYMRLRIPIFNQWRGHSQVKNAKLRLEMANNELENSKRMIYRQVAEDYQQLKAAIKEYEQLEIQRNALSESYKIAEKKYDRGLISIIELYTAKTQLTKAEADILRTKTQVNVKEKTIDFYTNNWQFLKRNN